MPASSAVTKLQAQLEKTFGAQSVVFAANIPDYEICTSGSLALDHAIGIGGLPSNRVIEIVGPEGAGKSVLSFLIIKSFLLKYPDKCAIVCDMEHRITAPWIEALIGEELIDRVIILWPDNAEESTDMYLDCVKSGNVCVFSYDSIGGSPSQRVTDKSATVGNIGGNALAMTRFAQFASIYSDKYKCLTICINQIRDDMSGYNRLISPGGHGLKHAYSLRIHLKPGKDKFYDEIGGEKIQVGNTVVAKIIKNSLAVPYRATHYIFYFVPNKYGFGIDTLEETIRLGALTGIITQGGRWYKHPALPEGQVGSKADLIQTIRDNPEVQREIIRDVMQCLEKGNITGVTTSFDPDDGDNDGIEENLASITRTDDEQEV